MHGDQVVATVPANTTSYVDTAWTPGMPTCYRVGAVNDFGPTFSDQACLGSAGGQTPPSAPTNLRVVMLGVQGVQLTWTDTSPNETGFQIQRDGLTIDTVGANVTSYVDPR